MKHDAKLLRAIRESMGMTQEKLAILSNVSERTVQRAEAGETMRLDTLADFAAALEVPLSELAVDQDHPSGGKDVALRRLESGKTLLDELSRAGVADFDCEVEPTASEMEAVLGLIRMVEERLPSPWEFDQRPAAMSLSDKVKLGSEITALLERLEIDGIKLFGASAWINAKYPRYDMDEGHRYTHDRQPFEKVMTLRLVMAKVTDDRIYRHPVASWGLDEAPRLAPELGDDVPF